MISRITSAKRDFAPVILWLLLALSIARLWLVPLPSSFWVDELVTQFVVAHPNDPSFAAAPQVPQSLYYWLPKISGHLFGVSEITYRLPSVFAMAFALFFIARLAARLIHRDAAWFAVFACLGLRGMNYHAADARPYALGIAVASAALLFLVRWMDYARVRDAVFFAVCAALLWRVHLIYWPFYLVFALYFLSRKSEIPRSHVAAVIAVVGATLIPVAWNAVHLANTAASHVIVEQPTFLALQHQLRWTLVAIGAAVVWLVATLLKWQRPATAVTPAALTLIGAWWLLQPLVLFIWSHWTGNSIFLERYNSIALPGIALATAAAVFRFLPPDRWRPATLALAAGVLLVMGQWNIPRPNHEHSDWRGAAREVNILAPPGTPVLCPSPFVEARIPVWSPDYPLPGFLYAHLPFYPIRGEVYLFPFEKSDGISYAASLSSTELRKAGRFVIYGSDSAVKFWTGWFAFRPEFAGWNHRTETFGDVYVGMFSH